MTNKNKKGNGGVSALSKQARQESEDRQDYSSLVTVLFYCSLIVFLPVLTFFLLKGFVLERYFSMTEVKMNISAAVGAVVALHIALALYIYRAYFGTSSSTKAAQDKQD